MKKLILGASLGFLLLAGAVSASAANDLKINKDNDIKVNKVESRQEQLKLLSHGLTTSVTKVLTNLEQLETRVEARITKMAAAGKNVAAAKAKVPAAQSAITEAKLAVQKLTAQIPNLANASSTPKEIRENFKTTFELVKTKLKTAHQAIVEVISALKPAANAK